MFQKTQKLSWTEIYHQMALDINVHSTNSVNVMQSCKLFAFSKISLQTEFSLLANLQIELTGNTKLYPSDLANNIPHVVNGKTFYFSLMYRKEFS